jgi:hypothetical protein
MLIFLIAIGVVIFLVFAVSTARAIWYARSGQQALDQRMTKGFSA